MHVYAEVKICILAFCYFLRANYFPQLREDLIWPCLYIFPPSPKQQKHSFSAFRCWDLLCLLKTLIWEERSSHQPKSSLLKLIELRDNFWHSWPWKSQDLLVSYILPHFSHKCVTHMWLWEKCQLIFQAHQFASWSSWHVKFHNHFILKSYTVLIAKHKTEMLKSERGVSYLTTNFYVLE